MKSKIVNHGKKDDAVSPVIGVMLMIVVTVVIAAVVALFATNVVTSTEVAPIVVMEMNAYSSSASDENSKLVMSTKGGDPLELAKLAVVVTDSTGEYSLTFAGLDQKGVGDQLEIGEKLTVFTLANMKQAASSASGGEISEVAKQLKNGFTIGSKIRVMVTFNETAVIYDKDIFIKAATEPQTGVTVTLDVFEEYEENGVDWYQNGKIIEESGSFKFNGEKLRITAEDSTPSQSSANGSYKWSVTLSDAEDENDTLELTAQLIPDMSVNYYEITGIYVGNTLLEDGDETTIPATGRTVALSTRVEIPTEETYTVTYTAGTGSGEDYLDTNISAGEYQLLSSVPQGWTGPSGDPFTGWEIDGTIKSPGSTITISDNVTATAKWGGIVTTPKVTFTNTTHMTLTGKYGSSQTSFSSGTPVPPGETVTITAAQKVEGNGYEIPASGWSGATGGTAATNSYSFTMPNGNVTVSATESGKIFDVTLDKNEGASADGTFTVQFGATSGTLSAVVPTSGTVEGYYTDDDRKVLNADGTFAGTIIGGWVTDNQWSNGSPTQILYAHYTA